MNHVVAEQIEVRRANADDEATALELIRAYYDYDHLVFDPSTMGTGLPRLLADPSIGILWLAEVGGLALGYALATFGFDLEFGGKLATITDFFVQSEYRGRGIGSLLMDRVLQDLRLNGARSVELTPERSNRAAVEFYRKAGFQALDRIPMHLYIGNDEVPPT